MLLGIMEANKRCERIVGRLLGLKNMVWQFKELSRNPSSAEEQYQGIQNGEQAK